MGRRRDGDRGSLTVEAMLAVPVIMLVLLLGVAAGRITLALGAVEAAARDAARQASLARTPGAARQAATTSATTSLQSNGLRCSSIAVHVDTSGFSRPVGQAATVTADISCTVPLADVAFPGMPGSVVKRASSISPLDPYRGKALGFTHPEPVSAWNPNARGRYETL